MDEIKGLPNFELYEKYKGKLISEKKLSNNGYRGAMDGICEAAIQLFHIHTAKTKNEDKEDSD